MKQNERKSMIKIRNGFSEQMNIYKCNTTIQFKEIDDRTRTLLGNRLFDVLELFFDKHIFRYNYNDFNGENSFCKDMLSNVFLEKTTGGSYNWHYLYDDGIYKIIMNAPYNEVFDLLWYICKWLIDKYKTDYGKPPIIIYDIFNNLFEQEFVGYRFINGVISPITDEIERKEIEDAFTMQYKGARSHLEKSLGFLSDREKPDYKNSIKESISAVESICKIIVGKGNATLGDALKILESKNGLKGQLKSGFEKLYNYTNDKGGIRHAEGLFESNVSFEEAKFMLVSCCAFVNYLIAEYGKTI